MPVYIGDMQLQQHAINCKGFGDVQAQSTFTTISAYLIVSLKTTLQMKAFHHNAIVIVEHRHNVADNLQ